MTQLPLRVLQTGTQEPLRESRELKAGPLTVLYEDGGLRYVRWGQREVLRRVYVAVRDRNWNTLPTALTELRIEAGADAFELSFNADCIRGDIQ
ncbi:MAG TPA: hypothetical protein VG457_16165, partial [Planctomycetota bacterium]|nr:hypothetical protein [Planctomycetota bacterium]